MRCSNQLAAVEWLMARGLNDCEASRLTGVPRTTIRDWRHAGFQSVLRVQADAQHPHDFSALPSAYAYLLGLYLGDGCISQHPRGVHRLRITLDLRYQGIIAACRVAMAEVMPGSRASVYERLGAGYAEVGSYSKHWPCLFPQHGAGPKHERRIALADWQREICDREPQLLLRGLIHSDGCRVTNRVKGAGKTYAYPRYNFTNHSRDIRQIFCDYCDALGIAWRQMNWKNISVARREAVAKLDTFIGPKT
jgi:hypothetical protein